LPAAAQALCDLGAQAALLKGGHLQGAQVVDVLLQPGQPLLTLQSSRIESRNVHGTGCTLSSAIAAHLALGLPLQEAVQQGRQYIVAAIEAGAGIATGQGHGPLNHGHAPQAMHLLR
jgi:hydroxymethylpyrimidine/phosphomethylpyrimidine kinase